MAIPDNGNLLTAQQVADMLTISRKTLRAHVTAGEIAYIQLGAGARRPRMAFALCDVMDFINRRRKRNNPSVSVPSNRIAKAAPGTSIVGFMARRELREAEKAALNRNGR